MNTTNIKKYAPKARNDFMQAVAKRLNQFGIYAPKTADENAHISDMTIDGSVMQVAGNSFDASLAKPRQKLVEKAQQQGFNQFVEHTAYTWFNRFCAIRFMELHDYLEHGLRILSPSPSQGEGWGEGKSPEILDHAQNVAEDLGLSRDHIIELKLAGNKDEQLYRELLIGQCHKLHQAMPFLFEALDDETELLLPDNLTRTDSLLRGLVNDIPEEDWQQVEIIGWLYQFYISEKKDQVIGKVVKSEDIPAATQLFTPNWIVKYLVQNSVGRQWLQTYPESSIKTGMEYYIEPAEQTKAVGAALAANTPTSIDPETIKVLDPACGSGHILVEAYQVLKSIYEERGYRSRDIPKLILENNLFGLDIDDRAAQLSGFALMMLARADDRRIFTREVQLNVVAMQSTAGITIQNEDWHTIQDEQQRQGLLLIIRDLVDLFEQAKTFGSLIAVPTSITEYLPTLKRIVEQVIDSGDLFAKSAAEALLPIIKQAEILANKYDAVVANPPYMGSKGMNAELKKFAKDSFPNSKSDLFAIFMDHGFSYLKIAGFNAMVTMQSWMFLSSYERMRESILDNYTIENMVHMGNGVMKIAFGTNATIFRNIHMSGYNGFFSYAENDDVNEEGVPYQFPVKNDRLKTAAADDFKKIPGSPIAYWVPESATNLFESKKIGEVADTRLGMATADNEKFLRFWYEVDIRKIEFDVENRDDAITSGAKWFPYQKGGSYRKWYGNLEYVVNWENDGHDVQNFTNLDTGKVRSHNYNLEYIFKKGITWNALSSSKTSARVSMNSLFDNAGSSLFVKKDSDYFMILAFINSNIIVDLIKAISPTLNYQPGDISKLPAHFSFLLAQSIKNNTEKLVEISKEDWNLFEASSGFISNFLVSKKGNDLKKQYETQELENITKIKEVKKLEFDNNAGFIEEYNLEQYVNADIEDSEVTLTINPNYRYKDTSDTTMSVRIQSDTLAELISYSIGCMMGRYSLDREGLVYAHAGNEGFAELEQQGAYNTFPADDDGIVPLTDQEWFADDATHRFREFVSKVWGEDKLQQNLDFVAQSLCLHAIKAKNNEVSLDTIRRYLSTQFYKDHLKTYKKRPIYWLFSSGKQKAFECLVYLHRYNAGTLARMRTEYVTPLLGKYQASADLITSQIDQASSTAETNRLNKSLTALEKKQTELREFDDKLKHHADMQISLDLDDGVKVNYGKFGDLLVDVKAVHGKLPTT